MSDYTVLTFWFLYSCIKTRTQAFAVICIKELMIRRGSGVTPDVKVVTSRAILEETLMKIVGTDMEFVKNFTPPDFQANNFTPTISPNFNSFSDKYTKK